MTTFLIIQITFLVALLMLLSALILYYKTIKRDNDMIEKYQNRDKKYWKE